MAHRVDTITQHVFAFDDDEITVILNALYEAGHDELADEIFDELEGECEDFEPDTEPVSDAIKVNLTGEKIYCDLVERLMVEIGNAVKDGRFNFLRGV